MSYYNELCYYLRQRRLPEDRIADILGDVADAAGESGGGAEQEFGPPQKYAESFPKGSSRSLGSKVTRALFAALLVLMVGDVLLRFAGDQDVLYLLGVPVFFVAIGLFLVTVALGLVLDRRLPPGFQPVAEGRGRAGDA